MADDGHPIDAKELGNLLKKQEEPDALAESADMPILQVQANALPDVYEEEEPKKK